MNRSSLTASILKFVSFMTTMFLAVISILTLGGLNEIHNVLYLHQQPTFSVWLLNGLVVVFLAYFDAWLMEVIDQNF